jgi:phosphoserine phosphatase
MKIVIFDFDKTLTKNDTFNGLILYLVKRLRNKYFFEKILYYFVFLFFIFLVKVKVISVLNFKLKLINLVFPLFDNIEFELDLYCSKIQINQTVNEFYKKLNKKKDVLIIIVSGSFSAIIKKIYDQSIVIGLEYEYDCKNEEYKIILHPYGINKLVELNKLNIKNIDILFTDSLTDMPLILNSKVTYFVRGSKIKKINLNHLNYEYSNF